MSFLDMVDDLPDDHFIEMGEAEKCLNGEKFETTDSSYPSTTDQELSYCIKLFTRTKYLKALPMSGGWRDQLPYDVDVLAVFGRGFEALKNWQEGKAYKSGNNKTSS